MNTKILAVLSLFISVLTACSESDVAAIKNEKKGKLAATVVLQEAGIKRFSLDSNAAPRPLYTQIYTDSNGRRNFTFLNDYDASIYFYDYETLQFIRKIAIGHGAPGIKPVGYYLKTMDSIYVYNIAGIELLLENRQGQIFQKISLIGNRNVRKDRWVLTYPQYSLQTAIPFIETPQELLLTGQYASSLPESLIDKFHFSTHIGLKTNRVSYNHVYPRSLYGSGYNWQGQIFTEVFADMHPDGHKLVYSFPVSHDLYIANIDSDNYTTVYGGSNEAGTISSIKTNKKKASREEIGYSFIDNDEYGAIKYDTYRKVYYRFLRKGIPHATLQTPWKDKPVSVIIMDENFHYLGETAIGTIGDWRLQNTFVTKEGLNIEYTGTGSDENNLTLKIYTIKKLP